MATTSDAAPETTSIAELASRLVDRLASYRRVVVAFSGGVDSSVVAAAAVRANLESLVAVTADSPSVARWQLDMARRVARELSIDHRLIETNEISNPDYARNDSRRCFHCKATLYQSLAEIKQRAGDAVVVSGTNADDLGDHRPGIAAGNEANVRTPLADLGYGKQTVRALATYFELSNAQTPASPCLASRIAYGVDVTAERLAWVESAESVLRQAGFSDCRVRFHADDLARIEVPAAEIERWFDGALRERVENEFRQIGFRYVTLDLSGLQSGSMNRPLVSISKGHH